MIECQNNHAIPFHFFSLLGSLALLVAARRSPLVEEEEEEVVVVLVVVEVVEVAVVVRLPSHRRLLIDVVEGRELLLRKS